MINNNENIKHLELFKVFFIISNKSNIENNIQFSLIESNGITNLTKIYSYSIYNINISVHSFDIKPNNLKDDDKDKKTQNYQAIINLNYNDMDFKGFILFKKTKNNFIYNFKIENINDINNNFQINLILNNLEQLKIYKELLINLYKQEDSFIHDLILDSLFLIRTNKIFYFDYYLEILKLCYQRNEVKLLLIMFKLERVKISNNFIVKDYLPILNQIEKTPDLITKYCNNIIDKNKNLKIFYTLLLYFRQYFDKENVRDLLSKKELYQYFIEILPFNHYFFNDIQIPEELVNEILKQKSLSYDIIEGTLSYISSNINKLMVLSNNLDSVCDCCIKNDKILNMNLLAYPKESDDLNEIFFEIVKIVNYELNINKQVILFNEEYFKKYIEFDVNKNSEKKQIIKNIIIVCQDINKDLDINHFDLEFKEVDINKNSQNPINNINQENQQKNIENNNTENYNTKKYNSENNNMDNNNIKNYNIENNNKKNYNMEKDTIGNNNIENKKIENKIIDNNESFCLFEDNNLENNNILNNNMEYNNINNIDNYSLFENNNNNNKEYYKLNNNNFIENNNKGNYNRQNNNILDKRLLMPTIGNVSVGKSYFLNSLFGIDFCQVKSDITTKFLLFIRHIDNLRQPRLYNLKPNKNGDSYDFIKDEEVITGENNIKNKIIEINNDFENDRNPKFYMLEIEIKSIHNKEFINKVDFVDVPGLNESDSDYINLYFPYIKDIIKFCLIIFSTENYNSKDTIEVINRVKNNIYVPMENFLLILNKIDKVDGKIEETLHEFKKIILNNESINYFNNTIVPVNSLKLKSEIQIEINFYHFINYYFFEYINVNKDNQLVSFLKFLKKKISNIAQEKRQIIKDEIKNLKEDIINEIKEIFTNFIQEIKSKGFILLIDFKEENEINILKIFYICFTKKLLIPKSSKTVQEINDYFDKISDYSLPKQTKINKNQDELFLYDNVNEFLLLNNLDYFFTNTFNSPKLKKYGNIVPLLNEDFEVLKNYILNSRLIYIPILGISNSGKSSFLNCLIQKDILTCDSSECTRRGMIIKYIEDKNIVSLYSIKFKSSSYLNKTYYYYVKNKLLTQNLKAIKEIIKITNETYPVNEEDSFFLLEINIKVLDEFNINSEIKNNICFIDFPGHNTNYNFFFDMNIYQNVLKMSSFFIYINSGKAFKEDDNKLLLSKLFHEVIKIKRGDISTKDFIDLCMFVFNKVDTLDKNEKNLNGVQKDIQDILEIPYNIGNNISCTFFSSLLYKKFLEKKKEYEIDNIIQLFYSEFKYQDEDVDDELFGEKEEVNFLEYLKKNLTKKVKFDYNGIIPSKIDNNYILSSEIYKKFKNNMDNFHNDKNILKDNNYEYNLLEISKILIYCHENISRLCYFTESYAEETFKTISIKIVKSYYLKNKEYNKYLGRFFYFMNIFFRIENNGFQNVDAMQDYENSSLEILNNIGVSFAEFTGEEIINKHREIILKYINENSGNYYILMEENGNEVDKIIDLIDKTINLKYEIFKGEIDKEIYILENKIGELMLNIGISQAGFVDKIEADNNLEEKIFIGFHIATFGISTLAYGLFYKLPQFLIYKYNAKKKFDQFINDRRKYMEKIMKNYSSLLKKNIEKYRNLTYENAKRLLGLLKSISIETDQFWQEAKKQYLYIFNFYKEIKKLE